MPDPAPILFSPDPAAIAPILDALVADHAALPDIAARFNTTTEALALWMTTPDIRERLEQTDSATCWRTRMLAAAQLPLVIRSLSRILDNFKNQPRATPAIIPSRTAAPRLEESEPSAVTAFSPDCASAFAEALLAQRSAETARKAATLLLRLSRIAPTAPPGREAPSAAPSDSAPLSHRAPAALNAHDRSTTSEPTAATIPNSTQPPDPIAQFFAALANIPPDQLETIAAQLDSPDPSPHELAAVAAHPHLAEPRAPHALGHLPSPVSAPVSRPSPHAHHPTSRSTDKPRPPPECAPIECH